MKGCFNAAIVVILRSRFIYEGNIIYCTMRQSPLPVPLQQGSTNTSRRRRHYWLFRNSSSSSSLFLCLLIFTCCVAVTFVSAQTASSSGNTLTEREVLNQFFQDTVGDQWIASTHWGTTEPICSWFGVSCQNANDITSNAGVVALQLPANNVARKIPSIFYHNMPHLTILNLQQNPIDDAGFEGFLPPLSIVNDQVADNHPKNAPLSLIDFSDCLLTHVNGIENAAAMSTLVELRLTKNKLTSFASGIFQLTALEKLHVNYNEMAGTISTLIGTLTNLREFYAYSNALTGTIPTEIGLLNKVQIFTLANNQLHGTIPTQVNEMRNLQVFSLHGGYNSDASSGSGDVNTNTGNSTTMALTGPVPSFANAPLLSKLFLADNRLSGPLPDDFLAHNTLATTTTNSEQQQQQQQTNNATTTTSTTSTTVLVNLRNNRITEGLPPDLRRFTALNLDLLGNELTIPIPDYFCTRSKWMNGLVGAFGCAAILCPPGTSSVRGQQTTVEDACEPCDAALLQSLPPTQPLYLGSTSCPLAPGGTSSSSGSNSQQPAAPTTAVDPVRALLEFYKDLDGPRWERQEGWDIFDLLLTKTDTTSTSITATDQLSPLLMDIDYCQFYGIICDSHTGQVQFLTLANNQLRGTIPAQQLFVSLTSLVSMDLSFNRVSFPITDNLNSLQYATQLTRLKLSHTLLTRLDGIGKAKSLTGLYLDGNDLETSIPDELWDLTKLDTLHLEASDLTGAISTKIGQLTSLRRLQLNENKLQGAIPSELARLQQLEFLDLSDNEFSGVLPVELNHLSPQLMTLRINGARGGLGGPLPALDQLPRLQQLELAFNIFTGRIPDNFLAGSGKGAIAAATASGTSETITTTPEPAAMRVRLTGNTLTGPLPANLATLFDDLLFDIEDNQITEIPSTWCSMTQWMEGEVGLVAAAVATTGGTTANASSSAGCNAILCPPGTWSSHGKASTALGLVCQPCVNNVYYGETVCEETGHVGKSDEMQILDELFTATGGRYWNLTHTNWTKSGIPVCYREGVVCAEPSADLNSGVSELRLTSFGMRGTIPTSIYQLPQVKRLAFSWNPGVEISFEGIGQAPQLEVLQLSGTKVGSLAGIEGASHILYELHLAKAGLEGTFPTELLQVETLRDIYLSDNRLTGKIPSGISGMRDLNVLKLDGNLMTGPIPGEVGLLANLVTLDLHGNRLSGLIPRELGKLQLLEHLDLANQQGDVKLTGPLYTFNTNPVLQNIDLSNNKFAGLLPANFLSAVNRSAPIWVNLSFNKLAGSIPSEFDVFTNLDIKLAGNMITAVPGVLCDNTNWMGGGMPNSCDFILCPPHKVAPQGYATSTEPCQDCSVSSSARFFGSTLCDTPPSQDERQVLTDFYHAMNGDNWLYRTNWLSDLTPCAWYGVYCLENLSVVDIRLANNGLENSGSDADALAILSGLTNLRSLDLKGNAIVLNFMSIPSSSPLEVLRVSRTGLKSLDGISRATKLKVLHAVDNELSGSFPGEIFALQNLQELYLSFNRINGTLPAMISTLQNLQQLYMYENELSGQLPDDLGDMMMLRELVLGSNYLSGTLPGRLSQLPALEQISLQDQRGLDLIGGDLPDFSQTPQLWYMDFSNNDIGGEIPDDFLAASLKTRDSVSIMLTNNEITGVLPESLNRFQRLYIDLTGNKIESMPELLCNNPDWMNGDVGKIGNCNAVMCEPGLYSESGRQDSVDNPCKECRGVPSPYLGQTTCSAMDSERQILELIYSSTGGDKWKDADGWGTSQPICSWNGIVCVGDQQDEEGVYLLNLEVKGLVGTLPLEIWSLPSLSELALRGNEKLALSLSGIGNVAKTLNVLDLSSTTLSGLEGVSKASNLKVVIADQIGLRGTFPEEILSLTTLQSLHLSFNMFVGQLPADIGRLSELRDFHASGNDFHGPIPSGIGYMGNLEELILDDCLISGQLPSTELSYLPRLRRLSIARPAKMGRKLTGTLPPFDKVPLLELLDLSGNEITGVIPDNFLSSSVSARAIDLSNNFITGGIPLALDTLTSLHLGLVNNEISGVSQELCDNDGWMNGAVKTLNHSCDAILCAPGKASPFGRTVDATVSCSKCEDASDARYYGSTSCEPAVDERAILVKVFQNCRGEEWHRNDFWLSSADICDWYGVGCSDGHVVLVNLDANNLRGHLPTDVFRLPKLELLWLNSNRVDIDFTGIGHAQNLRDLRLESTGLRTLAGIGKAKSLTALSVAFNSIGGRFPHEILELYNLRFLAMNSNTITGVLPTSFASLRYLRHLNLDSNLFVGLLPSFFDSAALADLHIADNELTGTIPTDFLAGVKATTSSPTISIDLSHNRLSGSIPDTLLRYDRLNLSLKMNQLTEVPPSLCKQEAWNGGDVGRFGCNGILCHPGTSSLLGRQTETSPCVPCPQAGDRLYGQAACDAQSSSPHILRNSAANVLLALLVAFGAFCW